MNKSLKNLDEETMVAKLVLYHHNQIKYDNVHLKNFWHDDLLKCIALDRTLELISSKNFIPFFFDFFSLVESLYVIIRLYHQLWTILYSCTKKEDYTRNRRHFVKSSFGLTETLLTTFRKK